ncbi:Alpha/beta hydrolase [Sphingomonas sp. EC-HK361]|nr:Alpha/beta hydrolase [Sphingomonas sp. EC-HK361]
MLLALTEVPRAFGEYRALARASALADEVPAGDGHPVLVIPGFMAGDGSTAGLRSFLGDVGYDARAWALGRNFGPRSIGKEGEQLIARLEDIHDETGHTVSLVGWSLGGIMARIIAQRVPQCVRQIVTLGSPFAGSPRATNVWRAYEFLAGHRIDDPAAQMLLELGMQHPPVPTTALYSRADGVVAWQNCRQRASATTENVEVAGSHLGLCANPAVLRIVADRLAQPEGEWQPYAATA